MGSKPRGPAHPPGACSLVGETTDEPMCNSEGAKLRSSLVPGEPGPRAMACSLQGLTLSLGAPEGREA